MTLTLSEKKVKNPFTANPITNDTVRIATNEEKSRKVGRKEASTGAGMDGFRMSWSFWVEGVSIPLVGTFGVVGEAVNHY